MKKFLIFSTGICSHGLIEIKFSANPQLIDKIKLNSAWFNSENRFSEHAAQFTIQTYYSDPFHLHISFDNEGPGFKFKETTLEMTDGFETEDLDLKNFKFYRNGKFHVLAKM
jgi:hypothetical protein